MCDLHSRGIVRDRRTQDERPNRRTAPSRAGMLLAVSGMLACASGCAPGRLDDLADCGKLSVGFGFGLEVHAKLGCLTHPSLGFGASGTYRAGHESREISGTWFEFRAVWPIMSWLGLLWGEPDLGTCNLSFIASRGLTMDDVDSGLDEVGYLLPLLVYLGGGMDPELDLPDPLSFHEATDLQLGGTLLLVSARVGVNPLEIVDLLLGFVGIDIAGDDPPPPSDSPKPTTAPTSAPTEKEE